jgi:hypothetical protein
VIIDKATSQKARILCTVIILVFSQLMQPHTSAALGTHQIFLQEKLGMFYEVHVDCAV